MNRFAAWPLVPALILSSLAAQQQTVHAVLLVQYCADDLQLNEPLLQALLHESSIDASLRTALGEDFNRLTTVTITLAEPQTRGSCQIDLKASMYIAKEWDQAREDLAVETVLTHLRGRLDTLLFDEPRARHQARRAELLARVAQLAVRLRDQQQKSAGQLERVQQLQKQLEFVDQQALTARIDLATESKATEFLSKMREELKQQRAELLTQQRQPQVDLEALRLQLAALTTDLTAPGTPESKKELQTQIADANRRLTTLQQEDAQLQQRLVEVQNQLTLVLEQLPNCALSSKRAESRLMSLAEEHARIAKELDLARESTIRTETDSITAELDAARSMLREIEDRLAHLTAVHVEALRPR